MKRKSFDMTTLSAAVRNARQKLYPSSFTLKILCQNIYSDRAHIIIVDKTNLIVKQK